MNSVQTKLIAVLLLAVVAMGAPAHAARVDNLYAAEVPLQPGSRGLQNAFDAALSQVLVKVTGQREAGTNRDLAAAMGDTSRYVQQYRINAGNEVWVSFDQVAVRRALDEIGASLWGAERPSTLVWLVIDDGSGRRRLLGAERAGDMATEDPFAALPEDRQLASVRERLLAAADARGIPLLLPLLDGEETASIPLSDVWGGFTESLVDASRRYSPDAVLVGRARSARSGEMDVRWTLLREDERFNWNGDLASGPDDVADFFAGRLATSAGSSGEILLSVDDVNSLDGYGRLSAYLENLDLVDELSVDRVREDRIVFRLKIRGDTDQLMRSIALQRILQPIDTSTWTPDPVAPGLDDGSATLHYRLMVGL
ncbi:MAG: DUF2066 domain-containing protein [Gammaproteobacteria bacterium]